MFNNCYLLDLCMSSNLRAYHWQFGIVSIERKEDCPLMSQGPVDQCAVERKTAKPTIVIGFNYFLEGLLQTLVFRHNLMQRFRQTQQH